MLPLTPPPPSPAGGALPIKHPDVPQQAPRSAVSTGPFPSFCPGSQQKAGLRCFTCCGAFCLTQGPTPSRPGRQGGAVPLIGGGLRGAWPMAEEGKRLISGSMLLVFSKMALS